MKNTRFSLANMTAGFVAVMIGFTSSVVLVFQAAGAAGGTMAEISSWLFALGMSIGFSCIGLSWYYRMPILVGWSTPGAALLVSGLSGVSMPEAVGAFMMAAFFTCFTGMTGLFERIITHIPRSLSSAMLAGILLQFGLHMFVSMQHQLVLVSVMLLTYLVGKRLFPRSVIIFVLLVGICIAKLDGLLHIEPMTFTLTTPIFIQPVFSLSAMISVAIPLFIVTMTAQNIPGITVMNLDGFKLPVSSVVSWIGAANVLFAPFGCYSISLTALTAAICAGSESDPNPAYRYRATIFAGLCWICIGFLGSTLVTLFSTFPEPLIWAVAGLALLGTIGNSLKQALEHAKEREPALLTILISASGMTLWGIGSAFWGLLIGIMASLLLNGHKKEQALEAAS